MPVCVGNSWRHILSCRGSYILQYWWTVFVPSNPTPFSAKLINSVGFYGNIVLNCFSSTTVGRIYRFFFETANFEWLFPGFQHSLWKCSSTENLYSLKSWMWSAVIVCAVRWPISNALLNDIWLTCSNYWFRLIQLFGSHFDLYQSLNRLPIWNSQNCSMSPLAFVVVPLQDHWWGFISRNYAVLPIFFLMNVFTALKGTHFWHKHRALWSS